MRYVDVASMPAKSAVSAVAGVPPLAVINAGFHVVADSVLKVPSKVPLVVPNVKPINAGRVVATPAVPGGNTQQWMCAPDVGAVKPLKVKLTRSV